MKARILHNRSITVALAVILGAVLLFTCVLHHADAVRQAQTAVRKDKDSETDSAGTEYPRVMPKDTDKKYTSPESDQTMRAARLPSMRIDGRIEDSWNVCAVYALENPVFGENGASAAFRAFSDDDKLYLLVEVNDKTKQLTGEAPTRCDSVEVFLNEDGIKPDRYHAGDSHYIFMRNGDCEERSGADKRLADYVVTETEDGYLIELSLRWTLPPEERAKSFGFDIRINDSQNAGYRDYIVQWSDTSMMTHENMTGIGTLTIR